MDDPASTRNSGASNANTAADINNPEPPDITFTNADPTDTDTDTDSTSPHDTNTNISSSCQSQSSSVSISELLQRDNWNSRTKYLQCDVVNDGHVSSSSSSTSTSDTPQVDDCCYGQLDRYGFIAINTDKRQVKRHQNCDEEERKRRLDEREASRSVKWLDMLKTLCEHAVVEWPSRHEKFEERLVKGVPDCIRCQLWPLLAKNLASLNGREHVPDGQYRQLYLKISGYERQIDLDIERTLRDHVMFKIRFSSAQVSLFKVLVAYSNLDPEVGYCQGMSTIAAFLLLYLPEEEAFAALNGVMAETRQLFIAGFPQLFETFYVQERLMRKYLPRLHQHLTNMSVTPSIYATKWYLTLFLGFPVPMACRIWDLFLFYGFDVLPCVAVAVLRLSERRLMGCEYEQCMQMLSRLGHDDDDCDGGVGWEGLHAGQVVRIAVRLLSDCRGSEKHRGFAHYRQQYRQQSRVE